MSAIADDTECVHPGLTRGSAFSRVHTNAWCVHALAIRRSTKIGLALTEEDEGADLTEAQENAEQAWQEDSKGRGMLSRKRWLDTVFELADVRTHPTSNPSLKRCRSADHSTRPSLHLRLVHPPPLLPCLTSHPTHPSAYSHACIGWISVGCPRPHLLSHLLGQTWTVGVDATEYALFLRSLIHRAAHVRDDNSVVWRADGDVMSMPSAGGDEAGESDGEEGTAGRGEDPGRDSGIRGQGQQSDGADGSGIDAGLRAQ